MALKIAMFIIAVYTHVLMAIPLESESPVKALDDRIVGGVDAEHGTVPHMVALVFGSTVISLTCGGSIVSRRHILTAAHCLVPFVTWQGELLDTLAAVVGTNKWNSRSNLVRFSKHINHPHYDSTFIKNDVGVLILREDLQITSAVNIIPLNFEWVDGGVDSYATGWGTIWLWGPIPDRLQTLNVRTISAQQCIDEVNDASHEIGWSPPVHPTVEICTFHSANHGMCHGDSGSALVDKQSGHQIGIVSWGFPCARGAPDVFVRISGIKHFLLPILQGHI